MYITPTTTISELLKERARIRNILHGNLSPEDREFFQDYLDEIDLYIDSIKNKGVTQ